ncbi:hypothetical protein ACFO5R_05375 [Halosolutus amylolyticus]|uniref:Uncharacterized protein n=1 Tax=Halosolutus amylolyticus TaxID=2932267 RepID=A0ABD5PLA4_9EURY|nr:hypothetical protein [Halosolutus amylolyticus]
MDLLCEVVHPECEVSSGPIDVIIHSRAVLGSKAIDAVCNVFVRKDAPILDVPKDSTVFVIVRRFSSRHLDEVKLERALDGVEREFDDTHVVVGAVTELTACS